MLRMDYGPVTSTPLVDVSIVEQTRTALSKNWEATLNTSMRKDKKQSSRIIYGCAISSDISSWRRSLASDGLD